MSSLIICKDLTKEFDPINPTRFFVPSDQAIICLTILDSIENLISVEFIWTYQNKVIVHESKRCIPDSKQKKHRIVSFLKMAYVEYEKKFGVWEVELILNKRLISKEIFIIKKPYGNYKSTNSLLNITI